MAEYPLTKAGIDSGWLQRFFNVPFDPICVMLAMRTKLLLDIIDEMGHSYNLLRNIGYGWIDWGLIPDEIAGNPDDYFQPLPDIQGPGDTGITPPTTGQPETQPQQPAEGQPGYLPPGGSGSPGSGFPDPSPGTFGPGGWGTTQGSAGGISIFYYCCYDNYDPLTLISIDYTSLLMLCDETQELSISGNPTGCSDAIYTWEITSGGGSLSAESGQTVTFTAPEGGEGCESPTTIQLSCAFEVIDTLEIVINPCPPTAEISFTSLQMAVNDTQELTIVPDSQGCGSTTYTWEITSGGGSLSAESGETVTFTAPATNANCTSNATIKVSCGEIVLDTIEIAINAYPSHDHYAYEISPRCWYNPDNHYWYIETFGYFCDNVKNPTGNYKGLYTSESNCMAANAGNIFCGCEQTARGLHDCTGAECHTPALSTLGCCPLGLL